MARGYFMVSVLSVLMISGGCSPSRKPELSNSTPSAVVKVHASRVNLREGKETFKLSGTVRSFSTIPLSSKIMGTVTEMLVRAGDRVKAGQLLAVIDSRDTDAMVQKSEAGRQEARMALQEIEKSLESAQANLRLASSTLKRYELLASQKSVSPQEFDEVEARKSSAQASVDALQARKQQIASKIQQAESDVNSSQNLRSYTQIQSPISGIVTQRLAEPGSLAVPGVPLLTVEETDRYRLEVPIEENRVSQIKLGQTVFARMEALSLENLQGSVSEIQPSADPASRTYLIKITLPAHAHLRSGMYGEIRLETGPRKGIWIQPESVVRHGQLEGVYVIEKGDTLKLRLIKLGETTAWGVEVLSGLEGGETYVTRDVLSLQEGSRVEMLDQSVGLSGGSTP